MRKKSDYDLALKERKSKMCALLKLEKPWNYKKTREGEANQQKTEFMLISSRKSDDPTRGQHKTGGQLQVSREYKNVGQNMQKRNILAKNISEISRIS